MKASLITIQSLYNYGAALQCFATFKYLKRLGLEVRVIDYNPKNLIKNKNFLKKTIGELLAITTKTKIERFNKKNLIYTNNLYKKFEDLKKDPPPSDIFIVGSDQVWNSQLFGGKLDFAFFLDFVKDKKKISYASSIGEDDVDINELKVMKEHLKDFSYISVREEGAKQLLESVGVKNIEVVLDPVFLLEAKDYEIFIKSVQYKKYLLIYSFEKNPTINKLALEISKKEGLQIIEIGSLKPPKYSNNKYLRDVGIEDFLSLIKHADFILTSSFHGTAFSLLFNKQFVSAEPLIRKNRLKNLTNTLRINERLIGAEYKYNL